MSQSPVHPGGIGRLRLSPSVPERRLSIRAPLNHLSENRGYGTLRRGQGDAESVHNMALGSPVHLGWNIFGFRMGDKFSYGFGGSHGHLGSSGSCMKQGQEFTPPRRRGRREFGSQVSGPRFELGTRDSELGTISFSG